MKLTKNAYEILIDAVCDNACRNEQKSVAFRDDCNLAAKLKGWMTCTKRSFAFKRFIPASMPIWLGSGNQALAQTAGDPTVSSGLSFENVRSGLSPVGDFFTSIVWALLSVGEYILTHAPAAAILSTIIAAIVAVRSISSQREMTRLRETFSTIDAGVWDKDVIAANENFKIIRDGLKVSGASIAKYASPSTPTEISEAVTLTTILNDYENIALGVRYSIIDELYLLRWMRSSTISDWETLSPLVTAYRAGAGGSNAYVEFEGLVTSWQHGKSYRTGKKITHARRLIRIS